MTEGRIERNGTGAQHFADGLVYSGQWKNDKMNGKGLGTGFIYNVELFCIYRGSEVHYQGNICCKLNYGYMQRP